MVLVLVYSVQYWYAVCSTCVKCAVLLNSVLYWSAVCSVHTLETEDIRCVWPGHPAQTQVTVHRKVAGIGEGKRRGGERKGEGKGRGGERNE